MVKINDDSRDELEGMVMARAQDGMLRAMGVLQEALKYLSADQLQAVLDYMDSEEEDDEG